MYQNFMGEQEISHVGELSVANESNYISHLHSELLVETKFW